MLNCFGDSDVIISSVICLITLLLMRFFLDIITGYYGSVDFFILNILY